MSSKPGSSASSSTPGDQQKQDNVDGDGVDGQARASTHSITAFLTLGNLEKLASKLQTTMVIGGLQTRLAKFFLDTSSERLFTSICRLLTEYHQSSRLAGQMTKRMLKMNMRIGLLSSSSTLSDDLVNLTFDYHEACHGVAELILRLGRKSHRILPGARPSRDALGEAILTASRLALQITESHLSEQSRAKFETTSQALANRAFLTTIFSNQAVYQELMERIYDDLEDLMDRGLF